MKGNETENGWWIFFSCDREAGFEKWPTRQVHNTAHTTTHSEAHKWSQPAISTRAAQKKPVSQPLILAYVPSFPCKQDNKWIHLSQPTP